MRGARPSGLVVAAVTGALLLAACGDDSNAAEGESVSVDPAAPPPVEPNGETLRVRSLDNSFRDDVVEIEAGTEILWTNDGRNEHDVLPVDETETWGVTRDDFLPGDEYRHVFLEPGTYPYYCSLHGTMEVGMLGTIVVTEADTGGEI